MVHVIWLLPNHALPGKIGSAGKRPVTMHEVRRCKAGARNGPLCKPPSDDL
jgi:hypothetical protein